MKEKVRCRESGMQNGPRVKRRERYPNGDTGDKGVEGKGQEGQEGQGEAVFCGLTMES